MAKVLYTATAQTGEVLSGYLDAASNSEALQKLKDQGLEKIELHSDALFGALRDDLEDLDENLLKKQAQLEAKWQKSMTFGSYLKELLSVNAFPLAAGAGMVWYGYQNHSWIWMSAGVIFASVGPFYGLWKYRTLRQFENVLKASTFGKWDQVIRETQKLRAITKKPAVLMEADTKEAIALAALGKMDQAMEILDIYKPQLDAMMPGMYENKLSELYYYHGTYDKTLELRRVSYEKMQNDISRLDLAMAELRFGSVQNAKNLLHEITYDALAAYAKPYYALLTGMVAYEESNLQLAKSKFLEAYDGMLEYRENSAMWSFIALIAGMLAIALYDLDEKEEADALLSDAIVAILKVHADKEMLEAFQKRFSQFS